ncbi:hypothetical protein BOW53_15600 [Solemya pervernicosa gill symbiont]|uniref:Uncharacterized protein n=2 Tax=Gammaproteobacteria incertae sedis TaxID=118884 RepID=A0A1T2L013_9GAMM|nr:hypothetical protein [Candidatus Reidiella endopervernicosa]OOZ38439.1 hypothetical protein BOW53_15600 [Solemya pervernicosa gill symbiont]QKQ27867.1 hypothetical protein HUE57_17455 [Candidatus Reidiella endopervernicosa]
MLSTTTSLCTTLFTGRLTRAATLIVIALWGTSLQAASIFILHSYSQEYNWTKRQHAGFIKAFESQSNQEPTYATEYLDTKRQHYSEGYADEILRHLSQKYENYRPDLIYVTDDNALSFARNHLPKLFPNTPRNLLRCQRLLVSRSTRPIESHGYI